MAVLDLQNLHVTFTQKSGDVQAVSGVSFSIDTPGQSIGIVGESGSGKSVTSLAIMRLLKAPQARVVHDKLALGGTELSALTEKQMQRIRGKQVSMIFQEPMTSLDPVFTISQQMVETIVWHQNVPPAEAKRIGADMLGRVEIADPVKVMACYPHQL